jgi:endonuclease YncB( thermonuclease family)
MIEALKSMYMNTTGKPVIVDFESNGKPRRMIIEPGATFDGNFYGATNVRINGSAIFDPGMKNIGNILQQAVILDYETTSKFGGAVITEASVYHVDENLVKTFYVKPYHMVTVGDADFFEQAKMSSKKGREVKNIKSNVTPRGHFASFFTRHLSDIFLSEESRVYGEIMSKSSAITNMSVEDITNSQIYKMTVVSEDVREMFAKLHTGKFKNRLEFEEAILTLDRQKKIFDKGVVRDELLKYTSVADRFQTRYYLNSAEEAERLGITSTLFSKQENRQLFEAVSYLRAESDIGVADLQKRTEDIFRDKFGRTDIAIQAEQIDIEDLIFKRLPQEIEGKTLYASNILFESKQTGATIRGIVANQLFKEDPNFINLDAENYNKRIRSKLVEIGNPFEEVMEAVSYTGDPFYTTGREYTYAKSLATKENTYADLFETFVRTTEGPGRARDIIDLQKMTQGATQRMGLNDIANPLGMSVEVQSRLFGAAQEIAQGGDAAAITRQLLEKEAHISAADAAISSPKIMEAALPLNVAAEEFSRGSELGKAYYKQALQGRGPLLGLFAYGELTKQYFSTVGPDDLGLADIHFEQRVARNLESVLSPDNKGTFGSVQGYKLIEVPTFRVDPKTGERIQQGRTASYANTTSYKGIEGVYSSAITDAKKYPGVDAEAVINRLFEKVNRDEALVEFDEKQGRYILPQVDSPKDYNPRILAKVKSITESNAEQVELFARRNSSNIMNDVMNTLRASEKADTMSRTSFTVGGRSAMDRAIGAHQTLKFAKGVVAPVMAFGLAMSGLSTLEKFQQPEKSSYLVPNYSDWFSAQSEMFGGNESFVRAMQEKTGYIEGMQETGVSSLLRKMSSDFGSPYTGPGYSDLTLERGELLRERQRKLRYMYTERHLSPTGDIKGMISSFISKSFSPGEMSYRDAPRTILTDTSAGAQKYTTLKGRNLTKVSLSNNYNISVQDADTITLKRNYGGGAMKDFFSGRKNTQSMSIRLAGIDAPETAHENRGAQPYAEAAKRIAKDMISRAKNVEVVFDESDSTYGRRVGMVYADGVNVNLELIKRGAAAYLPYRGKQKSSIYDSNEFRSAEESAFKSRRGMWRTDYFRSYKQIAQESGQTVTFNTLVNTSKVAQNTSLMTMYSAMKTSEAFGMQSTVAQQATADAGLALKNKASRSGNNIFKPDYMKNEWTEPNLMGMHKTNSILTGMHELKYDLNKSIKTQGSYAYDKHSALRVKSLDFELASETTSAKYNSFNKDYLFNTKEVHIKRQRLAAMQFLQQRQNNKMFNYNSGHHRM